MTHFYVPWAERNSQVEESVPPGTQWVDVRGSDLAYYEALTEIWGKGEDFAIIEHDVVIHDLVVEEFESCPEPWCVFGYDNMCHPECQEAWANQLGCTRFRAELMEEVPDALTSVPPGPLQDWHNVCDGLGNNLRAVGYWHHWHTPHVGHHPWFTCR